MSAVVLLLVVSAFLTGWIMTRMFGEKWGDKVFDEQSKTFVNTPKTIAMSVIGIAIWAAIAIGIASLFLG